MKVILVSVSTIIITMWGYLKVTGHFNNLKHEVDLMSKQKDSALLQRDSVKSIIDSLTSETQNAIMNTTRYEIALDRLREVDSIAAQKFDSALSNIE